MKKRAVGTLLLAAGLYAAPARAEYDREVHEVGVSSQPLREMTARSGEAVFYTLTRSSYPAARLPTDAEVVTPRRFTRLDAQNAGDVLSQKTGIQTLPVGGLGTLLTAGLRGAHPGETLVLVDGRPHDGVSFGAADLSEIPTEMIDHIEVIRSGASALYGPNAVGGVINIITRRAGYEGHPISHIGYDNGSFSRQTYRLDFGSRAGPLDYFFFGDEAWESGFRDNSDARLHNLGGNVGLSMGGAGKLLFDIHSFHKDMGTPGPDPQRLNPGAFNNEPEKQATTPTARQTTDMDYGRTSYLLPLPGDSLLALRGFVQRREVEYLDPTFVVHTDRHEQSVGGEAQVTMPLGAVAGASFIHDRLDSEDLLTASNGFITSVETWGVFAQENFHRDFLTVIPSARYDHHSRAGKSTDPRVQAIADATPWLRVSGSAGRSFRAPGLDDLYGNSSGFFTAIANPGLRPETAWTYDAGFELHVDSHSLRATYFHARTIDLIQPVMISATVFQSQNISAARRRGAEVQIDDVITTRLKNSFNYTYLQNDGILAGTDHSVALAFSPRHRVNDMIIWMPAKRWRLDATLRFRDAMWGYNPGEGNDALNTRLAAAVLGDVRLTYLLLQSELYLGVNDVTDKRYEEQPGFPLPGRTVFIGITLKLWD